MRQTGYIRYDEIYIKQVLFMFKRVCTISALVVASVSFAGMATAADDNSQQESQKLMKSYQSKAQQLKKIHDKAIKNNPDLAKQQEQFQNQAKEAIKKQGYDVDSGQEKMQSLAKKLQSGDLSDDKRKEVMQQFQEERQKMVKARDKALSQPEIKKAGEKLEKDTIEAMKKEDSKTEQLMNEMDSMRDKLQQSAQQQQQQQGGGAQQQQGGQ